MNSTTTVYCILKYFSRPKSSTFLQNLSSQRSHDAKRTISTVNIPASRAPPPVLQSEAPPPVSALPGRLVATVFGNYGFLGTYVVNRLARLGAQVIVPYRGEEKNIDVLKPMGDVGQIVPMQFDIRNLDTIERAIGNSTVVVNLLHKEKLRPLEKWKPGWFMNFTQHFTNVEAAELIAKTARKHGVRRLIHFSTVGADAKHPTSEYKRNKAEAEAVVKAEFPNATIIRLTTVFGAEDRLLNKYGNAIVAADKTYKMNPTWNISSPPDLELQPVYARDVAAAFMQIMERPETDGKTFELGGPRVFTLEDFIMKLIIPETRRFDVQPAFRWNERESDDTELERVIKYNEEEEILGFRDLGITSLTPIEVPAVNILRPFRTPDTYHD